MSKIVIAGWIMSFAGLALWTYGYFVGGTPSLVDWPAIAPWWIADFLTNLETEIGMALMLVAMVPIYWPRA